MENKKWSHLKQSQRAWIGDVVREEHAAYISKHARVPIKKGKQIIIDKVHDKIVERNIWIPYGEMKGAVNRMIDRQNRRYLKASASSDGIEADGEKCDQPCFALGLLECENARKGFVAMRPKNPVPELSSNQGFRFGHAAVGNKDVPMLQFIFHFYGHETYQGLVMPSDPAVQAAIPAMIDTGDYFFFLIRANGAATLFRSCMEHEDLGGLRTNWARFGKVTYPITRYEKMLETFRKDPFPPGELMEWVCRNEPGYLDLTEHKLMLNPA